MRTCAHTGTDTWRVTLLDNGSFAGFADPNTCDAMNSKGSFLAYTSPARNPAYTYVATGTAPAAGTSAPKGSTVVVYVKRT